MSVSNSEMNFNIDIGTDVNTDMGVDIVQYGEKTKRRWHNTSVFWMVADCFINIITFLTSISIVFVEVFAKFENSLFIILLAVIAATLTLIGFAIKPRCYMQKYRKAFNVLNAAMLKYYAHSSDEMRDQIVDAILKGEKIINGTYEVE